MVKLGINEKSLPFAMTWREKLQLAKNQGFDFIEMSVDETDERLGRLDWTRQQRWDLVQDMYAVDLPIDTMMLSGLRKFPLGSEEGDIAEKSYLICQKAIILARDLGIRNIQIAGYDEYYGEKNDLTRELFIENLQRVVDFAAENQIMIAIETMDDPFINSVAKVQEIKQSVRSPWLQAYPDLGNISAWPENVPGQDLADGLDSIVAIHVKDTYKVTETTPGKFKNVPFGRGEVNFLGLFKTLKRIGYQGTLTIEMWSEHDADAIEQVIEAQQFVQDLLAQAGFYK
ncbi:L-ribulose-5-phosphate 3-epimerase [Convivina praedatoris]|uniref:L-ribulose-5-phosphate 3-epimerase n=1 Tax=Convivina praedatoris TaxID=2880963 RepID=A0ABM9D1P1_9LACO|nr:L-ribulose-5-phosphate 3-epimerase [Convivina sp. LMG 32447]CAH1852223.1 L-ribulose-5-phosphate 3-epimerase UlaE [Convivina sp. LMG 32447]CAH1853701.1 L-ribulose-5-phosphate 3-epimerase UlaE [Convivina sp. LMG 32447]CAH1854367.1 L-ribulose-5-phosphate 3-epimerase UlaE [Convivina sp. LMG 32447]